MSNDKDEVGNQAAPSLHQREPIHVEVDELYESGRQRDNPDLRDKPVALGVKMPTVGKRKVR